MNNNATNIALSSDPSNNGDDILQKNNELFQIDSLLIQCFEAYNRIKNRDDSTFLTLSKDILLHFLSLNKIAELRLYLFIKRDFSGKIGPHQHELLAESMGISKNYLKKLIHNLSKTGLLEKRHNGWCNIIGVKRWNYQNAIMHPTVYDVPPEALQNTKNLRTFCRAVQITLAGKKAKATIQGEVRGHSVQSVPLSVTYISNFTGLSERTIKRHKSRSTRMNLLKFQKRYRILENGTAKDIPVWKENRSSEKHVIAKIAGTWCLCEQLPSHLTEHLHSRKKKLSFTREEKESIKDRFHERDLIPEKRKRELAAKSPLIPISTYFSAENSISKKRTPFLG